MVVLGRVGGNLGGGEDRAQEQPRAVLAATRLVCLPCQPMPAASASGFSITGAVSTKTFTSPPARATRRPAISFSLPLMMSW